MPSPVRRDHGHISSDIMQVDAIHTPINTLSFRMEGPVVVTYETPNMVSPSDQGVELFDIPAGVLFMVSPMTTEPWITDTAAPGDLGIVAAVDADSAGVVIADCSGDAVIRAGQVVATPPPSASTTVLAPRWALAISDIKVFASFTPDSGNLTSGSTSIYVIIATPAA
jgi:hypothetical protein